MIISKIELKNWRNFESVAVNLTDRVFVVGPNASGKSNFLDVFKFLRDIALPSGGLQEAITQRGGVRLIDGKSGRTCPFPTLADRRGLRFHSRMFTFFRSTACTIVLLFLARLPARAWDYEGHRLVNQIALASLPADFPGFARTPAARERIAFLSGEPDRWRNTPDLPLRHFNGPDHYFDVEDLALYEMTATNLSPFRYVFTARMGAARAANPGKFPAVDPAQNSDRTRELPGYLPWAITEHYAKLKSGFSYLKVFEELGRPEEVTNAQQNILYIMGTLGHYVGDAAQPLHTTRNYNGWTAENPRDFTTSKGFHAWIDGGYLNKVGLRREQLLAGVAPARVLWSGDPKAKHDDVFPLMMNYIVEQHQLVEPLYQMDKEGKLSGKDELGQQGQAFLEGQLRKAGQMLGDLWYSAWQQAQPDTYLKSRLMERKLAASGEPKKR